MIIKTKGMVYIDNTLSEQLVNLANELVILMDKNYFSLSKCMLEAISFN